MFVHAVCTHENSSCASILELKTDFLSVCVFDGEFAGSEVKIMLHQCHGSSTLDRARDASVQSNVTLFNNIRRICFNGFNGDYNDHSAVLTVCLSSVCLAQGWAIF